MGADSDVSMRDFKAGKWKELRDHLEKWFYGLDYQALEAILSIGHAHTMLGEEQKPTWIFVPGRPGSGKTEVVSKAIRAGFGNVQIADTLTDKTLLSGYQPRDSHGRPKQPKKGAAADKNKSYSMLSRMGRNPILVFPDFTTLLGQNPQQVEAIAAQLRRIWDGEYVRDTGANDDQLGWLGTLTVIALCTNEIERKWSHMTGVGERFMFVRWTSGDGSVKSDHDVSTASVKNARYAKEINSKTAQLVKQFTAVSHPHPKLPNIEDTDLIAWAQVAAWSRVFVERNWKEITDVHDQELPTRIAMGLSRIAEAHASLFYHETVEDSDLVIARRMAMDTIPDARRRVIDAMPDPPAEVTSSDLVKLTKLYPFVVNKTLDDLEALGIVKGEKMEIGNYWHFTDQFEELRQLARISGTKAGAHTGE